MGLGNRRAAAAAAALTLVAVGCSTDEAGGSSAPRPSTSTTASSPATSSTSASPRTARPARHLAVVGTVASGLRTPWGLAFLPRGGALVSERDTGRIVRIGAGGATTEVGEVPGVVPAGEGGLLGIAVSAHFARDRWLYAYFTAADDNRIVRMRYAGGRLGGPQVLVDGIPKGVIHNGGRIAFGPDGMLYAGTGETGDGELAQDKDSLGGKVLRMTPTGEAPSDNPFPGSLVWNYGHRNVQGITFDDDGRVWASEFGQSTWDELNLLASGDNYGWPRAEGRSGDDRYVDPVAQWRTDEASPSGVAFAGSAIYMAALRGSRLWQIPLDGGNAGEPKAFFTGRFGRLRTVAAAPDGTLWLTTSNTDGRGSPRPGDDRILRVALRG